MSKTEVGNSGDPQPSTSLQHAKDGTGRSSRMATLHDDDERLLAQLGYEQVGCIVILRNDLS